MERLTKIELNTGEEVAIETKLNIKKLMMINRDFNTDDFATLTFSRKDDMKLTILQAHSAVYTAYRLANMSNYMSYDEFTDVWDFDFELGTRVFSELLSSPKKKSSYRQSIEAVIKKK